MITNLMFRMKFWQSTEKTTSVISYRSIMKRLSLFHKPSDEVELKSNTSKSYNPIYHNLKQTHRWGRLIKMFQKKKIQRIRERK